MAEIFVKCKYEYHKLKVDLSTPYFYKLLLEELKTHYWFSVIFFFLLKFTLTEDIFTIT